MIATRLVWTHPRFQAAYYLRRGKANGLGSMLEWTRSVWLLEYFKISMKKEPIQSIRCPSVIWLFIFNQYCYSSVKYNLVIMVFINGVHKKNNEYCSIKIILPSWKFSQNAHFQLTWVLVFSFTSMWAERKYYEIQLIPYAKWWFYQLWLWF